MPEVRPGGEAQMRLAAGGARRRWATRVGTQGGERGDVSQVGDHRREPNDGGGVFHSKAVGPDERRASHGAAGRSVRHSRKGNRGGNQT